MCICVIGDGAQWIWNRTKELFPSAKMVLDYYHCSEYVHDLANAPYGKNSQKTREWAESILTRLFCNEIEEIFVEMENLKPSSEDAKAQINKTYKYLYEKKEKINYGATKRGGYHIGSGGIESSNKFISNVRLKRSGAWWYPTSVNHILKLRCAKYNGAFDRIMDNLRPEAKSNEFREKKPRLRLVINNTPEIS